MSALFYPKKPVKREHIDSGPFQSAAPRAQGTVKVKIARKHEPEDQKTGFEEAACSCSTTTYPLAASVLTPCQSLAVSCLSDYKDVQDSGNGAGGGGAFGDEMVQDKEAEGCVGCKDCRVVADANEACRNPFEAEEQEENTRFTEERNLKQGRKQVKASGEEERGASITPASSKMASKHGGGGNKHVKTAKLRYQDTNSIDMVSNRQTFKDEEVDWRFFLCLSLFVCLSLSLTLFLSLSPLCLLSAFLFQCLFVSLSLY